MGHPRKLKKKFSRPSHPWQRSRIDEEKVLSREYGLANMREIWKTKSLLKKYTAQAKRLVKTKTAQAEVEKVQLREKLKSYGLLTDSNAISDVLGFAPKVFMDRRLQTIVVRRGLARTMKQARQFIVHGHIQVSGVMTTSPSYLVKVNEESEVSFRVASPFIDEAHPERAIKVAEKSGAQ